MKSKILRNIFGLVKNTLNEEWRIQKSDESKTLFQKNEYTRNNKEQKATVGWTWRSQNPLIRIVLEDDLNGKISLGRPRLRWENMIKKDVNALGEGLD